MTRLIFALIVCLIGCGSLTTIAQTPKRSDKKTTVATSKPEAKGPVVIAVEDGKVYVDPLTESVSVGDRIVVYKSDNYFIHPVTKEYIARDMQDIAELEVEKVFATYIQTVPKPSMAISLIKPGMTIRKKEQIVVAQNQESQTPIVEQSQLTELEQKEQWLMNQVAIINPNLPSPYKNNQSIFKITVDGKTICYQHHLTSKWLYNSTKNSIKKGKFYSSKFLDAQKESEFNSVAIDLGYSIVDRWWNKDKTEYIDSSMFSN